MSDLSVAELGSGGDLILTDTDLQFTNSLFNQVYLAWFGGNVESNHEDAEEVVGTERDEAYWQNSLFFPNDNVNHYNSRLEEKLNTTALSSQGISEIEDVAIRDLDFLTAIAEVSVEVSLTGVDRVEIVAILQEKESQTDISIKFIWDSTRVEVIENVII